MTAQGMVAIYTGFELNENAELAPQPSSITVSLKATQLASLAKMTAMEKGPIAHLVNGEVYDSVDIAFGILADPPGCGKTLTALALIASNDVVAIPRTVLHGRVPGIIGDAVSVHRRNPYSKIFEDEVSTATLIVVKRGLHFECWRHTLQNDTRLSFCAFGTISELNKAEADRTHTQVFLVSDTVYSEFVSRTSVRYWRRCIVDDAADIFCPKMPAVIASFLWLLTSNPSRLEMPRNSGFLRDVCHIGLFHGQPCPLYKFSTVCNKESLAMAAFDITPHLETSYLCQEEYPESRGEHLSDAARLQQALCRLPEPNDEAVGCCAALSQTFIPKSLLTDIRSLENRIRAAESENLVPTNLRSLLSARDAMAQSIFRRLNDFVQQDCAICHDTIHDPIALPCYHVFCKRCLQSLFDSIVAEEHRYSLYCRNGRAEVCCPICRQNVAMGEMLKLTNAVSRKHLNKNETILKLLTSKPNGTFLIHFQEPYRFYSLRHQLELQRIPYKQLRTGSEARTIDSLLASPGPRVLFLLGPNNGAGLDLSFVTDVVVFEPSRHMQDSREIVGRAHRGNRKSTLSVHLLYNRRQLDGVTDYIMAEDD